MLHFGRPAKKAKVHSLGSTQPHLQLPPLQQRRSRHSVSSCNRRTCRLDRPSFAEARSLLGGSPEPASHPVDDAYSSDDEAYGSDGDNCDAQCSEWGLRKLREAAALLAQRSELVHRYIAHSDADAAWRAQEQQLLVSAMQARLDQAAHQHCCHASTCQGCVDAAAAGDSAGGGGAQPSTRRAPACAAVQLGQPVAVRLQHFTWASTLSVPTISCSVCGLDQQPIHPLEVGCFDGSVGGTACWFPRSVLEFFRSAHEGGGLGGKGMNR